MMETAGDYHWPLIRTVGIDGFVISFAAQLGETANRAALAFRDVVDKADMPSVQETSTSLVSTYVRFDPLEVSHDDMRTALQALIDSADWFAASLPTGRRLWRVPTAFGGDAGPQLAEAAAVAGMSEDEAIASIAQTRVRVQTIGFAPGMPYLGALPEAWDIPRQTALTGQVPAGGLCVAIRQLVLFPVPTPTGWRHIGQTAVSLFRPAAADPFLLRPGDEVLFEPTSADALASLLDLPNGGAVSEDIS